MHEDVVVAASFAGSAWHTQREVFCIMTEYASGAFGVQGQRALVTGASRGIGKVLATGLVTAGCNVVLNGRSEAGLQVARAELQNIGRGRVTTAAFDVGDPTGVEGGVASAVERDGPIDILINNAGIQRRAHFLDQTIQDWNDVLRTNLTGAYLVGQTISRYMVKSGRGKILNVLSVQSELARPGVSAYAAAKGGLKMLTRAMCADLAGSGIQVNGLGPGYFDTELNADLVRDTAFTEWIIGRTPAGRWGDVEDLIGPMIFLVSHASDFVNGQVIYVDGGMTAVL